MSAITDLIRVKAELLGSLKLFTEYFFYKRTGRDFVISDPIGRESHYVTVFRELVKVFRLETKRLIINLPPGHAKSTMLQHFVAWAMAHYPDSQILYISYSKSLAEKHTATIKQIMELPVYKQLFDVSISQDSSAKGHFKTTAGGTVIAFGSTGSITGQDAGLPNLDRFSGLVVIDDAHKPDEVHSDVIREGVIQNYNETIKIRPRGPNVPIVFLGQCLHEADLSAYLKDGKDGYDWKRVVLKAIDEAGNALCPNINSLEMLRNEQLTNAYVFASQFQQDPIPAGGALFKRDWFPLLDDEPDLIATFITADTAETDKTYNDATAFSFFGVYKIQYQGIDVDLYGLYWIDAVELRVEPKDLKAEFLDFWSTCMRHKVKPKFAAIEKKSTGVTLISVLKDIEGLAVIDIERTGTVNSKTNRFIEMQQYIARKQVTLPAYGKHTAMCINHMSKITANNSHRFDDLADTLSDGIKMALVDKIIINKEVTRTDYNKLSKDMMANTNTVNRLRRSAYT